MQSPSPDEIREQMAQIRTRLPGEVHELAQDAKQLVDWRHYFRTSPWASLAVAAGLGFLIVPRRSANRSLDSETLCRLAKQGKVVVQPEGAPARPGLLQAALAMASTMLVRAGAEYATRHVLSREHSQPDHGG